jgi:hypothetical protein
MELSDIIEKLEYTIEEKEGFFEVDLDFELERTVVVVDGYITREFEPNTSQFYGDLKYQNLEIYKCWIQYPDFEAKITDKNIEIIEKYFNK